MVITTGPLVTGPVASGPTIPDVVISTGPLVTGPVASGPTIPDVVITTGPLPTGPAPTGPSGPVVLPSGPVASGPATGPSGPWRPPIVVIPPIGPTTPTTPTDTGPFVPTTPGQVGKLVYPGLNPGFVQAGIRPAYQTSSPVQSQYAWTQQPYFYDMRDLMRYNTQQNIPATPFGLQQGFWETGPVSPATRAPAMTQAQFDAMNLPNITPWTYTLVTGPIRSTTTVPTIDQLEPYEPYPTPLFTINIPTQQTTTTTKVP